MEDKENQTKPNQTSTVSFVREREKKKERAEELEGGGGGGVHRHICRLSGRPAQ
jgi:hypothetical protein